MVTKADDAQVSALKKDLRTKQRLVSRLELLTLKRLADKHGLSIRQVVRINRGEQRGSVK